MKRKFSKTLGVALLLTAPSAFSAPVRAPSNLPLFGDDINLARSQLSTEEDVKEFSAFISSLDVFPDHTNPENPLDRITSKKFYAPPLFQPSLARDAIGTQEIADWGLKILENVSILSTSFDLNIVLLNDVLSQIVAKRNLLAQVEKKASETSDQSAATKLKEYAEQIRADLLKIEGKRDQMLQAGAGGLGSINQSYRDSVRNQVILSLAQLGVSPSASEQVNLMSADPSKMVLGIAQIISRASKGQYGVRQAIFESGYTAKEKRFVAIYKSIRPDVQVVSLPTNATYVFGTAQSQQGNSYSNSSVVESFAIYRGMNLGTNGKCGNTYTCNVVIEYTNGGARMAALSKTGVVAFPVLFESDATFIAPNFEGSVECNFKNGWSAKGRSDVKDGAIVYDGDVYDKIHFKSDNEGGCKYSIVEGSASSAAYHAIKRIYDLYDKMFHERTERSKDDKAAYEQFVRADLDRHAKASQGQKSGMFDGLTTWTAAFGNVWGTVATVVVNEARNFYWHTRIEDTSSIDSVNYKTTIKEKNVSVTERFTYDGFPRVCWKRGDAGDSYMSACPDKIEYKDNADNDLGKAENNCNIDPFETCQGTIDSAPLNEDGVVVDPGAAW